MTITRAVIDRGEDPSPSQVARLSSTIASLARVQGVASAIALAGYQSWNERHACTEQERLERELAGLLHHIQQMCAAGDVYECLIVHYQHVYMAALKQSHRPGATDNECRNSAT